MVKICQQLELKYKSELETIIYASDAGVHYEIEVE